MTAVRTAWDDLFAGAMAWRVWFVLTSTEIRSRYRRSRLGQFWFTLSMAVSVLGIGFVYGGLFRQPYVEFVTYLAVAFPLWLLIASMTSDSANVFIQAEAQMKHYTFSKTVFIWQMIMRNLFIFLHNIVLIVPVFLFTGKAVGWPVLAFIPALLAYILTGLWMGLLFGTLGTRFRDVPQILSSITQMAFFVTPVIFRPTLLPESMQFVIDNNPFAALLAIGRDPLLGQWPRPSDWLFVAGITIIGFAIALPVYGRCRRYILYWL